MGVEKGPFGEYNAQQQDPDAEMGRLPAGRGARVNKLRLGAQ